jgi:hypothetical protein
VAWNDDAPRALIRINIQSSARHVEIYIGTINAKGILDFQYVETVRGTRTDVAAVFELTQNFQNQASTYSAAHGISFKFLSLQPSHDRKQLLLEKWTMRMQRSSLPAAVPSALAVEASAPLTAPPPVVSMTLLLEMQQAMQRQAETKLFHSIDMKLSELFQRLDASEARLRAFTLATQSRTTDSRDNDTSPPHHPHDSHPPLHHLHENSEAFQRVLTRLLALEKEMETMKREQNSSRWRRDANANNNKNVVESSSKCDDDNDSVATLDSHLLKIS